jgi:hypothetical protein
MDLLPLYLADEVSEETRVLIDEALAADAELAQLVEQANKEALPNQIPIVLDEEDELKAFKKAKRLMFQHNLFLVLAVIFTFMFAIGMTVLLDDHPIGPVIFSIIAGVFWLAFFKVNKQLSE